VSDRASSVFVARFEWERRLRASASVTGTRLLVLLALATYMDADGAGARPTQQTLAKAIGLQERAVRGHLTTAIADGWIERTHKGRQGSASVYRATIPAAEVEDQPASPCRLEVGGTEVPVSAPNRHLDVAQPASPRRHTGTGMPPTTSDHAKTTAPDVRAEAERRLGAKKRAGERIASESGLLRHLEREVEAEAEQRATDRVSSARNLGATMARAGDSEESLEERLRRDGDGPLARAAALEAYRSELVRGASVA
jgi:hypothetical protein